MPSAYETYLRRYLNDGGALWTSAQIERWATKAEQEICKITPSVVERVALSIVADRPLYQVPEANLGISQITYKGDYLVPLTAKDAREMFPEYVITDFGGASDGAFYETAFQDTGFYTVDLDGYDTYGGTSSRPQFWAFTGYDERRIQLFPTPNETIASTTSNLWNTEIPNRCIIEYRTTQGGTNATKPMYRLVRLLIKDYVLSEAFRVEGPGQDIKVAEYLKKRFNVRLQTYTRIARGVFVANTKQFSPSAVNNSIYPRRPNFGSDIGRKV